jgi:FemAB-related protein (PEP-CTERM system-associated)
VSTDPLTIHVSRGRELDGRIDALAWREIAGPEARHGLDPRWLRVLRDGLRHDPVLLEADRDGQTTGYLCLAMVRSLAFGRFAVSLPYVSSAGVVARDPDSAAALVEAAMTLAKSERVKFLELRHERSLDHPLLPEAMTHKVHMRLALPPTSEELWDRFKPKVRNQVRKAEEHALSVAWGGSEMLGEFYRVFSRNMRDLGTPVYGRRLFAAILRHFAGESELCVVRQGERPIASALLVHGHSSTEVPSASSLRSCSATNANMLLYWNLLKRSIDRGQREFDFGRSSEESGTFRFKKQWGAVPSPAVWQYHRLGGSIDAARPENKKFGLAIRLWQRLPLWVANALGPGIVRGIP